jgi:predicted nuclease of predicted toxin-antitoxin system
MKLYTDEDVNPIIATHLRRNGYDALSAHDAGRANQRIPDDEQLEYATQQGRAIFTFNVADYIELDIQWKAESKVHCGIIVSKRIENIGELIRSLKHHIDTVPLEVQNNLLLWLMD